MSRIGKTGPGKRHFREFLWVALLGGARFFPAGVMAETWEIREDGTGDAPPVQAGIDSAAVGDTVLVHPGMQPMGGAMGHEVSLAPASEASAVVLPEDESGLTRVALLYDLSGLVNGQERTAVRAVVEWTVPGVAEDDCLFTAYPIAASWNAGDVGAGEETLDVASQRAATWAIESRDYDRHGVREVPGHGPRGRLGVRIYR